MIRLVTAKEVGGCMQLSTVMAHQQRKAFLIVSVQASKINAIFIGSSTCSDDVGLPESPTMQ